RRGRVERPGGPEDELTFVGTLSRTTAFSSCFGLDRGTAVDRVSIETLLSARAHLIRGQVLEVSEDAYASRLRVDRDGSLDIVDMDPDNPDATIIADPLLAWVPSLQALPLRDRHPDPAVPAPPDRRGLEPPRLPRAWRLAAGDRARDHANRPRRRPRR